MQHPEPVARRPFELTESICLVNFFSPEPNARWRRSASATIGTATSRDAPRRSAASPVRWSTLPSTTSPTVRWPATSPRCGTPPHRRRHTPRVSRDASRRCGGFSATASRRRDSRSPPSSLAQASTGAPTEPRIMYAGLRALTMPEEPVARLWHAANMLREHRGDRHIAALVSERIGGTEANVLGAPDMGIYPAGSFGRVPHLPPAPLGGGMDGPPARGPPPPPRRLPDPRR